MMKKIKDNCWSDILEEVRKNGIHCLGRKIEHKGTEASRLISWGSQRKAALQARGVRERF